MLVGVSRDIQEKQPLRYGNFVPIDVPVGPPYRIIHDEKRRLPVLSHELVIPPHATATLSSHVPVSLLLQFRNVFL